MTVDEAITAFSSYSLEEKKEFPAHLIHELTVIARYSYQAGEDGLTNPQRVRRINELQHQLSGFLRALLLGSSMRYPDETPVRIILEHPDDDVLEKQFNWAFERLTTDRVSIT